MREKTKKWYTYRIAYKQVKIYVIQMAREINPVKKEKNMMRSSMFKILGMQNAFKDRQKAYSISIYSEATTGRDDICSCIFRGGDCTVYVFSWNVGGSWNEAQPIIYGNMYMSKVARISDFSTKVQKSQLTTIPKLMLFQKQK